jgi:hypothetical protein
LARQHIVLGGGLSRHDGPKPARQSSLPSSWALAIPQQVKALGFNSPRLTHDGYPPPLGIAQQYGNHRRDYYQRFQSETKPNAHCAARSISSVI